MSSGLPDYDHAEVGWVVLAALGIVAALAVALRPAGPPLVVLLTVMAAVIALAGWMRVVVHGDELHCQLGIFARRRIAIARIASADAIRLPWFYGWGIRLTPGGWLWRVSGLRGVRLTYDDGGQFTIGTSDDEALARAITRRVAITRPK